MKTLLVVDDEFDLTNTIRAVLESSGYRVETAHDGRQAIEQLQQTKPDLVLMDVMMPVMDGLGVLRKIRNAPSMENLPVILMCVLAPSVSREEFRWQMFLRKPFTLENLLKAVEQQIGKGEPARAEKVLR